MKRWRMSCRDVEFWHIYYIKNMKKQRIVFIDLARGMAIFFMILQHVVLVYNFDAGESSDLGGIFLLLGTAPAAPVFMLIMGIFFGRSKQLELKSGIVRGLKLLAMGYALNLVRFVLPVLITGEYGEMLKGTESPFPLLFVVDILQMAGLALIVLTLVKRYIPWTFAQLSLATVIMFLSPLLWGILNNFPLFSPLWGTGSEVVFPLFPWIIYPLIGMIYGRYLLSCDNIKFLMRKTSIMGLSMFMAGVLLWNILSNKIFVIGDYSRSGAAVHLTILGFIFVWLHICWWIAERIKDSGIFRLLFYWSKNVTVVYIIQWILIGWGTLLFGYNQQSMSVVMLIGAIVFLLTHVLTRLYIYLRMLKRSHT